MGTVNLLEVFRKTKSLKTGIFITTDKCYENIEKDYSYVETDPMGGYDPYSASKGAAELVISSYRRSFFQGAEKKIASVRAGNVIGGGDWSPHRIIVDIVKAIQNNDTIEIRNPLIIPFSSDLEWFSCTQFLFNPPLLKMISSKVLIKKPLLSECGFGIISKTPFNFRSLNSIFLCNFLFVHYIN